MKLKRLETHDRLSHFKQDQADNLFQGVDDCVRRNKDCVAMQAHFPYVYIFAHPRTADDGVTKRMIYQPRLSKPAAQTNSYLFRLLSNTDVVEIIWILPPREMWGQYQKGKVTESEDVLTSIYNFIHKRKELEAPHKDDWSDERIRRTLRAIQKKETNREKD